MVVTTVDVAASGSCSLRALLAADWLLTVTPNVEPAAMSLAGISARSWELLSNTVGLFCPFQRTTDDAMNSVPFTVRVNPRSEEHTSELQSHSDLVCRLLLEKKK